MSHQRRGRRSTKWFELIEGPFVVYGQRGKITHIVFSDLLPYAGQISVGISDCPQI